jgi:hypothetical protein
MPYSSDLTDEEWELFEPLLLEILPKKKQTCPSNWGLGQDACKNLQDEVQMLDIAKLQVLPLQSISLKPFSSTGLDYFWTAYYSKIASTPCLY